MSRMALCLCTITQRQSHSCFECAKGHGRSVGLQHDALCWDVFCVQAENETLQQLLVQLAADRNAAEAKLKEVKERYSSTADLESLKQELDAGKMPAALADLAAAATATAPAAAPAAAAAAPAAAVTAEAPAAPAAAAAQAAPPPPPPPPPKPSHNQLQQLAAAAVKAGKKIFTLPDGPAVAGQPCTVYYDRSRGPLPGGSAVALKVRAVFSACVCDFMICDGCQSAFALSALKDAHGGIRVCSCHL